MFPYYEPLHWYTAEYILLYLQGNWTVITVIYLLFCMSRNHSRVMHWTYDGGTAAAAPPPFRLSDPALCGSCPLVTPYYCRLGELLCIMCVLIMFFIVYVYVYFVVCIFWFFLCSFFLQYFDTVGWVFWPVKTVSHITYSVLAGTSNTVYPIQWTYDCCCFIQIYMFYVL